MTMSRLREDLATPLLAAAVLSVGVLAAGCASMQKDAMLTLTEQQEQHNAWMVRLKQDEELYEQKTRTAKAKGRWLAEEARNAELERQARRAALDTCGPERAFINNAPGILHHHTQAQRNELANRECDRVIDLVNQWRTHGAPN